MTSTSTSPERLPRLDGSSAGELHTHLGGPYWTAAELLSTLAGRLLSAEDVVDVQDALNADVRSDPAVLRVLLLSAGEDVETCIDVLATDLEDRRGGTGDQGEVVRELELPEAVRTSAERAAETLAQVPISVRGGRRQCAKDLLTLTPAQGEVYCQLVVDHSATNPHQGWAATLEALRACREGAALL